MDPEDIDANAEDHCADALAYGLQYVGGSTFREVSDAPDFSPLAGEGITARSDQGYGRGDSNFNQDVKREKKRSFATAPVSHKDNCLSVLKNARCQRVEFFTAGLAKVTQGVQRAARRHRAQLWQGFVR